MHIIIAVALPSMAQGLYWLFDKHIRHHRWRWHISSVTCGTIYRPIHTIQFCVSSW